MNGPAALSLAFIAGGILGGIYLFLLWVSVQSLLSDRRGAGLFLATAATRLALAAAGLYVILRLGDWHHVVSALAGFVLVRGLVTRRLGLGLRQARPTGREIEP